MGLIFFILVNQFINKIYKKSINKQVFFILFILDLYTLYSKDYFFCTLAYILLFHSITDIINYDVYSILNYLLMIISFLKYKTISISILIPIILAIINVFKKGIGQGDIELLFGLSFIFEFYDLVLIVFIASILNLIYSLFSKNKLFPFVPFLSIATMIIYLFYR